MSNFKLTSSRKQSGKVVYSMNILRDIVTLAVTEVEGTVFEGLGKKNSIAFNVDKDTVYVDISVVVKYGYNVPELAYRIQQSVKQSVENMTHFRVAEVDVHILDVVFCPATAEKENVEVKEEAAEEQE